MSRFISVIIPTHNQSWELDKTLFSLEKQFGISHNEYEIMIVNTNPNDLDTVKCAEGYLNRYHNLRFIQVYDEKAKKIRNATYGLNLGVRKYIEDDDRLLLLLVDSARVPTPGVLRKMRQEFERWGDDILVTTVPYHFYKHSSTPGLTIEEVRDKFMNTRWRQDFYHLFDFKADTNISLSGIHNEGTYLGITKRNYMKVNGHNEFFTEWSSYNLDLFRRLTREPPKDGIQIPGEVNDHWGKIGTGLKLKVLEGEADFHLHHSLSDSKRSFSVLRDFKKRIWEEYERLGDCIHANLENEEWGTGDSEEIFF